MLPITLPLTTTLESRVAIPPLQMRKLRLRGDLPKATWPVRGRAMVHSSVSRAVLPHGEAQTVDGESSD